MTAASPPSRFRLWAGVPFTIAYLAVAAWILHIVTNIAYWWMVATVVGLAVVYCGTTLTWLILWARRKDSRLGQFSVGSLLFLTLFVSLFLSFVSWVADNLDLGSRPEAGSTGDFLVATFFCGVLFFAAIPLMIWATESAVWLAVLAVRSRMVRRRLAFFKRGRGQ